MIDALKIKAIIDLMETGDNFLIEIPECFTITASYEDEDIQSPEILEIKKTNEGILEIKYLGRRYG